MGVLSEIRSDRSTLSLRQSGLDLNPKIEAPP